jgi:hypothetical protein
MGKTETTLTYVGRYDAIELRRPDGSREIVERGEQFTTTPDHAASLLTQDGEWKSASPAAKTKEG